MRFLGIGMIVVMFLSGASGAAFALTGYEQDEDMQDDMYVLHFSARFTASYQHHRMSIDTLEEHRIAGTLILDANIGPQGRAPMPWERRHVLAFEGSFDAARSSFVFSVAVPGHTEETWIFNGYVIETAEGRAVAGMVTIEGGEVLGFMAL